ncbi:MAG: ribulose-phosphate 3-epimerase [Clostridia bacterium]|nr:ribulose-phosphate 3-epimerase [Clostridia bacterium]
MNYELRESVDPTMWSAPEIAPSVLSADFGYLMDDIKAIEGDCTFLHLDVMDGHYVPNMSIGLPVIKSIRKHTDMIFDTHLMIDNPDEYIAAFADAGSDYITFHVECSKDPLRTIELIKAQGKKAGMSIHPDTPIETVVPYLKELDLFLVMSVRPGFGGQKFMPEALERLKFIRTQLDSINSKALLSVDGGVINGNASDIYNAGATLFVTGSTVFCAPDKSKAVKDLKACALS